MIPVSRGDAEWGMPPPMLSPDETTVLARREGALRRRGSGHDVNPELDAHLVVTLDYEG
jgi:hypothetical protein